MQKSHKYIGARVYVYVCAIFSPCSKNQQSLYYALYNVVHWADLVIIKFRKFTAIRFWHTLVTDVVCFLLRYIHLIWYFYYIT